MLCYQFNLKNSIVYSIMYFCCLKSSVIKISNGKIFQSVCDSLQFNRTTAVLEGFQNLGGENVMGLLGMSLIFWFKLVLSSFIGVKSRL